MANYHATVSFYSLAEFTIQEKNCEELSTMCV